MSFIDKKLQIHELNVILRYQTQHNSRRVAPEMTEYRLHTYISVWSAIKLSFVKKDV